jgi:hypothetical protein
MHGMLICMILVKTTHGLHLNNVALLGLSGGGLGQLLPRYLSLVSYFSLFGSLVAMTQAKEWRPPVASVISLVCTALEVKVAVAP